jgi:hypothetical protein
MWVGRRFAISRGVREGEGRPVDKARLVNGAGPPGGARVTKMTAPIGAVTPARGT